MVVGVGEYWEEDEEWLEEFPGEDAGGRIQSEISGGDDGDDVHADVDEEGGANVHHVAKVAGGVIYRSPSFLWSFPFLGSSSSLIHLHISFIFVF